MTPVADAEASHIGSSGYEREAGTVTLRRAETRLVSRYLRTLPDEQAKRLRLVVGWNDLYLVG
jgi:hypothetical protein